MVHSVSGLSRGLTKPHWGFVVGRYAKRPTRPVLVPDGAPVRNVPGNCNKKTPRNFLRGVCFGAPSGTRTQDPLIKSQLLYQPANTISRKFNLNVDKIKMAMAFMSLRINLFIQNNKTKLIVISLTQLCKLLFHHKKHLFNFLLEFWLITEYGIKYQSF